MIDEPPDFESLLQAASAGDASARSAVAEAVHEDLRRLAAGVRHGRPSGDSMRTTALVHEACLRLLGGPAVPAESRSHFLCIAARAMRQILVDHARAAAARKRGGGWTRVPLDGVLDAMSADRLELVALHEALRRLERIDSRKCQVVELRFFAGLTIDETAAVLGLSHGTVEADWRFARAWLRCEMEGPSADD